MTTRSHVRLSSRMVALVVLVLVATSLLFHTFLQEETGASSSLWSPLSPSAAEEVEQDSPHHPPRLVSRKKPADSPPVEGAVDEGQTANEKSAHNNNNNNNNRDTTGSLEEGLLFLVDDFPHAKNPQRIAVTTAVLSQQLLWFGDDLSVASPAHSVAMALESYTEGNKQEDEEHDWYNAKFANHRFAHRHSACRRHFYSPGCSCQGKGGICGPRNTCRCEGDVTVPNFYGTPPLITADSPYASIPKFLKGRFLPIPPKDPNPPKKKTVIEKGGAVENTELWVDCWAPNFGGLLNQEMSMIGCLMVAKWINREFTTSSQNHNNKPLVTGVLLEAPVNSYQNGRGITQFVDLYDFPLMEDEFGKAAEGARIARRDNVGRRFPFDVQEAIPSIDGHCQMDGLPESSMTALHFAEAVALATAATSSFVDPAQAKAGKKAYLPKLSQQEEEERQQRTAHGGQTHQLERHLTNHAWKASVTPNYEYDRSIFDAHVPSTETIHGYLTSSLSTLGSRQCSARGGLRTLGLGYLSWQLYRAPAYYEETEWVRPSLHLSLIAGILHRYMDHFPSFMRFGVHFRNEGDAQGAWSTRFISMTDFNRAIAKVAEHTRQKVQPEVPRYLVYFATRYDRHAAEVAQQEAAAANASIPVPMSYRTIHNQLISRFCTVVRARGGLPTDSLDALSLRYSIAISPVVRKILSDMKREGVPLLRDRLERLIVHPEMQSRCQEVPLPEAAAPRDDFFETLQVEPYTDLFAAAVDRAVCVSGFTDAAVMWTPWSGVSGFSTALYGQRCAMPSMADGTQRQRRTFSYRDVGEDAPPGQQLLSLEC